MVTIVYLLSMLLSVYLLLKTSFTDPGVIPRKDKKPEDIEKGPSIQPVARE